MARRVVDAHVCVCLLRRLPLADFGQRKVAVTHLCTFDCHIRLAEPGRTVMGVRYSAAEAMLGVFSGVFEGDLSYHLRRNCFKIPYFRNLNIFDEHLQNQIKYDLNVNVSASPNISP